MLTYDGAIFGQDVRIVLDTFLLTCVMIGALVPFVPFFAFGFIAKGGNMSPGYRLAVAWGLGLFALPLAMFGGVVYSLFNGGCIEGGPAASIMGVVSGSFMLTTVVARQAFKLDEQRDEEERLRKEADASMATSY